MNRAIQLFFSILLLLIALGIIGLFVTLAILAGMAGV
jgi:hypothetical protein